MKKIIGLSCGRKNGNCETFLKAALMGAAELGVESEIIRAMDLKVLPCDACDACFRTGKCVKNDDVDWVLEKTMTGDDAVIVSAPVYHIRTSGYLLGISEKMNHFFKNLPDSYRNKMGAAISVGGTGYDGWSSLGLPTIQLFLQQFCTPVDQVQINHCSDVGAALTPDQEWAIEKCRQIGRNVAKAMNMPPEEVRYVGEDTAVACPVCHCNILYVDEDLPKVSCPMCQVHGTINYADGRYKIDWNMKDADNPRFSKANRRYHDDWIMRQKAKEGEQIATPETQEKIRYYKGWGNYIRPGDR
ncbi:MAG: flavodoxin family protein [Dehalococcoidia bacterium]|jgi:multimeric flavodoxin WrbA